jgi:hypothetical protein
MDPLLQEPLDQEAVPTEEDRWPLAVPSGQDRREPLPQVAVPLEQHIRPLESIPSGHERWEPLAKEIVPAATSRQDELDEQEAAPLGLGSLEVLPQEVRNRIFSYLPLPHLLKLRQVYPASSWSSRDLK